MDKEAVRVDKLVFGGQGLAKFANGKKVLIWGVLPGELVRVRVIKNRRDYAEAIAEEIIQSSPERIKPKEINYLSTSPWQIMSFEAENKYKKQIIKEVFRREKVALPEFRFVFNNMPYGYRNKMEYSFWGDEQGLHLALHKRGSRGKNIVSGSALAMQFVDKGANAILKELSKHNVRAGDLKTVVVRASQKGDTVASLFVKIKHFIKLDLPSDIKGLTVNYSNPKSPASVITSNIYELGQVTLTDQLLGTDIEYNSDSFFQVNIPIFNTVLKVIKQHIEGDEVVDMYGGVGSIGLSVASKATIVEPDKSAVKMAKINVQNTVSNVVLASAEDALSYILKDKVLIVDPPRAGLHKNVITSILQQTPKQIIYLSCNSTTQARDTTLLKEKYDISYFEGYNFFPRTPHIETLAILQRSSTSK